MNDKRKRTTWPAVAALLAACCLVSACGEAERAAGDPAGAASATDAIDIGGAAEETASAAPEASAGASEQAKASAASAAADTPHARGELLASLPDRDVYLYADASADGVILVAGGREQTYDWLYMTPRGIEPQLQARDYDGDGREELAVDLYIGSGTGLSIEELHIVDIGDPQPPEASAGDGAAKPIFADHVFRPEDYLAQLDRQVAFRVLNDSGKLQGEVKIGNDARLVSLKDFESDDAGPISDKLVFASIVRFELKEDGIEAGFGAGVACQKWFTPLYVGEVTAGVKYKDGAFALNGLRFRDYGGDADS